MKWDEIKYKAGVQEDADVTINNLKAKGVDTELQDGDLDNLIFTGNGKTVKMSHHSFYRYSGTGYKKVQLSGGDYKLEKLSIGGYMKIMESIVLFRLRIGVLHGTPTR